MDTICLGCGKTLPEGEKVCSVCGFSAEDKNPAYALTVGTVLQERYVVGKLIRKGVNSLLYLGYNRLMKEPCFVQECYPGNLCQRQENQYLTPLDGKEQRFIACGEKFHGTMRMMAKVRDLPGIIPVYDLFEENNSFYAVSDYCAGMTLTHKLKQSGGQLRWNEARPLFMSLISAVSQLHSVQIHHLAICPDNILIGRDGKAHLYHFDIAEVRCEGNGLETELAEGFAAPEQYGLTGAAGMTDATDVYGLAATLYRTVTGNTPPKGNQRAADSDDLYMSAQTAEELGQEVCGALFNALQVNPQERTASVEEFREQLSVEPNVTALRHEVAEEKRREAGSAKKAGNTKAILIVAGTAAAALILALLLVFLLPKLNGKDSTTSDTSMAETLPTWTTSTTKGAEKVTKYAIPSLTDQNYYDLRDKKLDGGMTIRVEYLQYSDKAAGTVLSQNPAPGESAEKGAEITVVISSGNTEKITVPDVSGWKQEQAELYLKALGFRVEVAQLQVSGYEKGLVDSTDPAIGTQKRLGDMITLRVSDVEAPKDATVDVD